MIRDLSSTRELDRRAMSALAGGTGGTGGAMPGLPSVAGLAGIANVNVSINQNLVQTQNVNVAAFNDVRIAGPNFLPMHLDVSPALYGGNFAAV
jgi:hypothetical protein